jgi:hypothetical protein
MRRGLQIFLALFGAIDIVISLLHLTLGPSAIPGSIPVNATMDSEDRFYATLFTAYGAALLWCVRDVERKQRAIELLALVFFIGGIARLISIASVGLPDPFFRAMTGLELFLPFLMVFWARRVAALQLAPSTRR